MTNRNITNSVNYFYRNSDAVQEVDIYWWIICFDQGLYLIMQEHILFVSFTTNFCFKQTYANFRWNKKRFSKITLLESHTASHFNVYGNLAPYWHKILWNHWIVLKDVVQQQGEMSRALHEQLKFSWERKIASVAFKHSIQHGKILNLDQVLIWFTAPNR